VNTMLANVKNSLLARTVWSAPNICRATLALSPGASTAVLS
jgi:hypothetical protein